MGLPLLASDAETGTEFLAVVADEATRQAIRAAAAQLGWPSRNVREGGAEAARALLANAPAPALLVVDVGAAVDALTAMDALADVCDVDTRVVAIGETNDIGLYRGLMQMGVSDYLVKPVAAESLVDAFARALRSEPAPVAASGAGKTVAVVGARGGVGATSVALSLAWSLAHEQRRRTVLLDLDLQFGAAALNLDLEPGRGLREILSNPERIDSLLVSSAMVQESPNLRVLAAEESLDDDVQIGDAGVQALLGVLAGAGDAVIVDTPRRTDGGARELLSSADTVVVVVDLSLAAMRDAQRLIAMIGARRPQGEILVVANRVGGVTGEVPRAEFERAIGRPLDAVIPADERAAAAAAELAKPLLSAARAGPAATELRRLAERLTGAAASAAIPADSNLPSWVKRIWSR